jgi:aryl-alcohol dehydrogenase-like predicted oxidoreductase
MRALHACVCPLSVWGLHEHGHRRAAAEPRARSTLLPRAFQALCDDLGVTVIAYSPLALGLLTGVAGSAREAAAEAGPLAAPTPASHATPRACSEAVPG